MLDQWLLCWFQEKTGLSLVEIEQQAGDDYFNLDWVDSMGFIKLIVDIEEHYQITFTNNEFRDNKFRTLGGLSKLLHDKYEISRGSNR